jgi:hypothetical protein
MPSDRPPRLFFLHILKTGGTSFYRFLENNYARDESIRDDRFAELHTLKADPEAFLARLSGLRLITKLHVDFSLVEQLRQRDPALRVVTLLRQPVQRCISMIEHWRRVPSVHMASLDPVRQALVLEARTMPVLDFVEKHQHRLSDHQTKMLGGEADHTANPPRGELLAKARKNLSSIEYVGLTERMPEMATCLSSAMGFFNSMSSERLNVTREDRQLSAAERSLVAAPLAELNRADAALYAEGEQRFWRLQQAWKHAAYHSNVSSPLLPLAVGERFRTTMDDPLIGDGWHEREGSPEQSCRWGGPQRFSSLWFPHAAEGMFELKLTILSVISDEVLASMRLSLNGVAAPHHLSHANGKLVATASASLPVSNGQPLHLELCFDSTRSAFDVAGLDDHRQKTVAVEAVELRRIG